jgi:Protein kinase domain
MPLWARVVVAVAGAKVFVGVTLYLSGLLEPAAQGKVPTPVYGLLASVFLIVGSGLVLAQRRDPRASWLGGLLVLFAAPLAPLVSALPHPSLTGLTLIHPEAFIPAFLWQFAGVFPSRVEGRQAQLVSTLSNACAVFGLYLVALNLVPTLAPSVPDWVRVFRFQRGEGTLYWPSVLGLGAPALVSLLWRSKNAEDAERRRARLFALGLGLGMAPFSIEVILEELFPSYKAFVRDPAIDPWIGVTIFGALALVPFLTVYSVLFDRVLDVRVVLRAALQYALARYTIILVTVVPFLALGVFLVNHRGDPLASLVVGARPLLLAVAAGAGGLALRARHRWLEAIDRRYFREPYDAQRVLTRFVVELQATTPEDLAACVRSEIDRAMHADVAVFYTNDAQTALRHIDGTLPPLPATATLVALALNDLSPMNIDLDRPDSPLRRLPDEEKRWVEQIKVALVVALRRRGALAGLLAISAKRSGLEYSTVDRQLLSAIAAATGLALDNLRLRLTPDSPDEEPSARECLQCSRLTSAGAPRCECGGALTEVPAPKVLRGVFRLEQRIGAGGMGVVYRAVDLNLRRDVAVKTLPSVTPSHVARLRREAWSMAAVTHANLAVIHGIETWRGIPFLISEFLAGGTLSHKLTVARLSLAQVIDLGVTLAGALETLHGGGILHCDIKPSNIGFTSTGIVKLLDFGLARLIYDVSDSPTVAFASTGTDQSPPSVSASASGGMFGTPYYMSPEMITGNRVSTGLDLWSLSVVLFEALAGRRPFEGRDVARIFERIKAAERQNLRSHLPECPAAAVSLFDRWLSLDPSRRPSSAAGLRRDLELLRREVS